MRSSLWVKRWHFKSIHRLQWVPLYGNSTKCYYSANENDSYYQTVITPGQKMNAMIVTYYLTASRTSHASNLKWLITHSSCAPSSPRPLCLGESTSEYFSISQLSILLKLNLLWNYVLLHYTQTLSYWNVLKEMPLGSFPFHPYLQRRHVLLSISMATCTEASEPGMTSSPDPSTLDPAKEADSFCFTVSRSHPVGHALLSRACLWDPDTALFSKISGFHSF